MKLNFVARSWILFGSSVALWVAFTLFESALVGIPPLAERLITLVGLVLLPAVGVVLGVLGLIRQEGTPWLALLSTLLNALFGLFHLLVVLFAG